VLSVAEKRHVLAKNSILVQVSRILTIMYFFVGSIYPLAGAVLGICLVRNKLGNKIRESSKWLKGAKLEDFEDALIIWIG
jgi:hypothetical protein